MAVATWRMSKWQWQHGGRVSGMGTLAGYIRATQSLPSILAHPPDHKERKTGETEAWREIRQTVKDKLDLVRIDHCQHHIHCSMRSWAKR